MLKKLTANDIEDIKKILPPAKLYEFTETYLSDLVTWYAFGYYDDSDSLRGISCVHFSGELPEWTLLSQYCDDAADMSNMIAEVCSRFEKGGLFRFSWVDLDYSMDYLSNFIPDRYYSFKDYETPAWTKPRFKRHFDTLYNSGWFPVKSQVYLSILKSKDRNF